MEPSRWRLREASTYSGVTKEEGFFVMRILLKLIRDTRGVGAIEYVLVASLISVAAIAAFDELGGSVNDQWSEVETSMAV